MIDEEVIRNFASSMLIISGLAFKVIMVLFLFMFGTRICEAKKDNHCHPSSCGNIQNISYPFRLKDDPKDCGEASYELSCENNRTVLDFNSKRYIVNAITYQNFSIRITDPGLARDNCSPFPIQSLSLEDIPKTFSTLGHYNAPYVYDSKYLNAPAIFIRCSAPMNSSLYVVDSVPKCGGNSASSLPGNYSYVAFGDGMSVYDVGDSCGIEALTWISFHAPITSNTSFGNIRLDGFESWGSTSFQDIRGVLAYGFELLWVAVYCESMNCNYCYINYKNEISCVKACDRRLTLSSTLYYAVILTGLIVASRCVFCSACVFAFLVYKLRRRHLSAFDRIEEFLQSSNDLMLVRYSYSQIRKMTWGFKEKLGQGGYGTVFRGKLVSGPLVAVKMMGQSRATGQEFLNEMATIGRIHHVNVVHLIGFCAQGSKRALVYDYMPNGSLEKYIFHREERTISLSRKKMYEISLGVARGIEYLHLGCNMQILHFDIKPHNILLDKNFIPKISDFGLAKLYRTDDIIVTLTRVRGTVGYMAPELFYTNIGGVSYKTDVYSFGMLLMEMAGQRKNWDTFAGHSSQIDFSSWAYEQLNRGKEIEIEDHASESERKLVKKMIMIALWCIQMKPSDRPPMTKVVEMLEEDIDQVIEMPPQPFLFPEEVPTEDSAMFNTSTMSQKMI